MWLCDSEVGSQFSRTSGRVVDLGSRLIMLICGMNATNQKTMATYVT